MSIRRGLPRPAERQQKGITGVHGGIRSIAQLLRIAQPSVSPASVSTPPAAVSNSSARGNRTVAVPTTVYKPQDATQVQFVDGVAHWSFSTMFKNPPIITAIVVGGASSGAPTGTYVFIQPGYPTATTVIINSTWTGDGRLVHITATGNPD